MDSRKITTKRSRQVVRAGTRQVSAHPRQVMVMRTRGQKMNTVPSKERSQRDMIGTHTISGLNA